MHARVRLAFFLVAPAVGALLSVQPVATQAPQQQPRTSPGLPSETPEKLEPVTASFDYAKRTVMIPMRDGVKLHTVIVIPKGAAHAPILLTRTPYSADEQTGHADSAHLGSILNGYDNATEVIVEGGYIRAVQDVRGKYKSEGDYVMNRPLHGALNPTPVDHSTDTWDTIDWLVKHVPESNGKVGILGISYDGFLPLMALVNPHPALKVAVPMNPMVDGWKGDDWFHYGAFRQQNMPYIYNQAGTRKTDVKWWTSHFDDYDMFMQAGSAGELGRRRGLEQVGFWRKILEHPAYDAFWREQAMDRILGAQPLAVPVMLVHSLWDQEDIYGAIAVYKAIEPKDTANDKVFLVLGPWHHGQEIDDGSTLGALKFNSDTGLYFRTRDPAPVPRPLPERRCAEGRCRTGDGVRDRHQHVAAVAVLARGLRRGLQCASDARVPRRRPEGDVHSAGSRRHRVRGVHVGPGEAGAVPRATDSADGYTGGLTWSEWLVDDQREASGRPDVLAFVSDALTEPLKISGEPIAHLVASTSGTDADWVVKVIDVYPDEVAAQPAMGGFQLMVSADIFRGRYRESLEVPKANRALTRRSSTDSRCPRRTTCSCQGTG